MTFTSNKLFKHLEIVRDTPFIDMDAFSTINLFNFLLFNFNLIIHVLSKKIIFLITAIVSTCP